MISNILIAISVIGAFSFFFPTIWRHFRRQEHNNAQQAMEESKKKALEETLKEGEFTVTITKVKNFTHQDHCSLGNDNADNEHKSSKGKILFKRSGCSCSIGKDYLIIEGFQHAISFQDDIVDVTSLLSPNASDSNDFTLFVCPKSQKPKQRRQKLQISFKSEKQSHHDFHQFLIQTIDKYQLPKKRKYLVLINPTSGKKKAKSIWNEVKDIFSCSRYVEVNPLVTKYGGHASEIVSKFDFQDYHGILVVSGDGLIWEVLNAVLNRTDVQYMIENVALGVIPAGTGNGLAATIRTIDDPEGASMRVLKGRTIPLDVFSVERGSSVIYGSLMVSYGFISDCDFGSEKLKWMGEARYDLYATWLWISSRAHPAKVSFQAIDETSTANPCKIIKCEHCINDRHTMIQRSRREFLLQKLSKGSEQITTSNTVVEEYEESNSTSHVQYRNITIEEPLNWLVASNISHIGGAVSVAPTAHLSDGHFDLTLIRKSRLNWWSFCILLLTLDTGNIKNFKMVEYYKVKEFELDTCRESDSKFDIDGEPFPNDTKIKVKQHQGLISILA